MSSLVRIVEPPRTWRVPRDELEFARRFLPTLSNLETGNDQPFLIKESPDESLYRFPGLRAHAAIYVTVYRRNSWRYVLGTPPGTREAKILLKLQEAQVPVRDLVAFGMRRRFPFAVENLLVLRSASNLWTLGRWSSSEFREHGEEARRRVTPVLSRILTATRKMHDVGVHHGDLDPGNILIDTSGKEFLFVGFHHARSLWPQERRRRVWDVCTLLTCFGAHYDASQLLDLACAYAPSSGSLSRTVRALWDETTERIRRRWIDDIVDQCCEGGTYFQQVKKDAATLYMDRSYDADAICEFLAEGCRGGWRHEKLPDPEAEACRRWREAVRGSVTGEIDETPVAVVCRSIEEGGNLLIWDSSSRPKYLVSHAFSLERFDRFGRPG